MNCTSRCANTCKHFSEVALISLVVVSSQVAWAMPTVHGDFSAATVDYLGIQEESDSHPGTVFLGTPTVSDDSLGFNPVSFAASSSGGPADGINTDEKTSKLEFTIATRGQEGIHSIGIVQAGSTTLAGLSGEAQSSVKGSVTIDVAETINAAGQRHPLDLLATTWMISFFPKNQYSLNVDGTGSLDWTGSLDIPLRQTLAKLGVLGFASKVKVTADFSLTAISMEKTSAFIQMLDLTGATSRSLGPGGLLITAETVAVPEPGSSLFLVAMLPLVGCSRRMRFRYRFS